MRSPDEDGEAWRPADLRIASPCHVPWDDMCGNDRVRFCDKCRLNVYNLSEMTAPEAEQLLLAKEGRLCVRYFQRTDGTILTRDCPVGLWSARTRMARTIAGGLALSSTVLSWMVGLEGCWGMGVRRPSADVMVTRRIPCTECTVLHPGRIGCPRCHGTGTEKVDVPELPIPGAERRADADAWIARARAGEPHTWGPARDRLRRMLAECIALGPSYAASYEGVPTPADPAESQNLVDRVKSSLREAIFKAEEKADGER